MAASRYSAADLIEFGRRILAHPDIGFTDKQALSVSRILVEADLRGDQDHGIVSGDKIEEILAKVRDEHTGLGFNRIATPAYLKRIGRSQDFIRDPQKYPALLAVDANGLPGHYVALEIMPEIIATAKKIGYAKAYIRNSTHFGNCGIYSEMIAQADLAARVTCTSPAWTKPFIEPQADPGRNRLRYAGVRKRFGTNPIAWSIPYDRGIVTIDMATTQRAVSPAVNAAQHNAEQLGVYTDPKGLTFIGKGTQKIRLEQVHLALSKIDDAATLNKALAEFGYDETLCLKPVEPGLLMGPAGEDIHYPLAFDSVFKNQFWIAPLGGTLFGYKGFGLNMLVELDNVIGGGETGWIRKLNPQGKPETPERVSQTLEAHAIDAVYPLAEAKARLGTSVRLTGRCGNDLMILPGEKEQRSRDDLIQNGIPVSEHQLGKLRALAERLHVPFCLKAVASPPI